MTIPVPEYIIWREMGKPLSTGEIVMELLPNAQRMEDDGLKEIARMDNIRGLEAGDGFLFILTE